jgi:pyruvate/2-oxoglutarate dehydrogenase complex dihydrolipoamide dehydrogenase (E3) component
LIADAPQPRRGASTSLFPAILSADDAAARPRVTVRASAGAGRSQTLREEEQGMSETFDAIIIGTGQAGPPLARRLTGAGMRVAIVERHLFGGTCVNTGCIPTKAMVASAYAAYLARRAADYGVTVAGAVGVDMARVKARKDEISGRSRDGLERSLRTLDKCTVFTGHARFTAPHEVQVGDGRIRAERIFINVGARAAVPLLEGIDKVPYLTNSSILALDSAPPHLIIVGGSYIGLEFGQMFRRFGSEVTIIEKGPRLIDREDHDVAEAIGGILTDEGIDVRLNAECISVTGSHGDLLAGFSSNDQPQGVSGSHLLIATGRRPNTDDLGLDVAGIAADARHYIEVDDQLRTNVEGIWALGDCNGKGGFTHTSYNDFEIVASNLLDGVPRGVSDRIPAYGLYIDPPLGRAGLTEREAVQRGHRVLVGQRPMTRISRAIEKGETKGLMKIVVDADSDEILGAAVLGCGGDEVIHGILDMMYARARYPVLQRAMHIHPTVSELVPTILGELKPAAAESAAS